MSHVEKGEWARGEYRRVAERGKSNKNASIIHYIGT
jgi:hypothetical protein